METIGASPHRSLVFAAVAELGSFTAAAAALGCSKAHASKQVRAIEGELGVELLHRTTRRVQLTEAGRVYVDYCYQARDLLVEGNRAVSAMRTEVAGLIRVTAPPAFGHRFLPELMVAFHRAHPAIRIEADLSVTNRDLVADRFDVAIRSGRVTDQELVARPLGVMRDVVVASRERALEHGRIEHPSGLVGVPCIVNGQLGDDSHWVFQRDGETTTVSVDGPLRVNQYTAIKRMVLAGAGAARLPAYLVTDELEAGALVALCSAYELVAAPTFLVHPQRRVQPLRCRVFVDFVQGWFAEPERARLFGRS